MTRSRIGRLNRRRGADYERAWVRTLKRLWPDTYRVERSGAGREKGDIVAGPLRIQLRSGQRPSWQAALAEAITQATGDIPAAGLVVRGRRNQHVIVLTLDDLIRLIEHERRAHEPARQVHGPVSRPA